LLKLGERHPQTEACRLLSTQFNNNQKSLINFATPPESDAALTVLCWLKN